MIIGKRCFFAATVFSAFFFILFEAHAQKTKIVSGLVGEQDDRSKELLALSPDEARRAATHDLLSLLKPSGTFTIDSSHNVASAIFYTEPSDTEFRYTCRSDRVTLQYGLKEVFDAYGKKLGGQSRPDGVVSQRVYHIERLPVPEFGTGTSYKKIPCDTHNPDDLATWFSVPSDQDAVRAVNMFHMAVDAVKFGRLMPEKCDEHKKLTCSQWILSLNDISKIKGVETCKARGGDKACYVVSFDSVDVTINGTIRSNLYEQITPAAITSIRAEWVMELSM